LKINAPDKDVKVTCRSGCDDIWELMTVPIRASDKESCDQLSENVTYEVVFHL